MGKFTTKNSAGLIDITAVSLNEISTLNREFVRSSGRNYKFGVIESIGLQMKRSIVLSFCCVSLFVGSNSVQIKAQDNEETKYLRPSITNIYIDRGEKLPKAVIEKMKALETPAKFNDNRVSNNTMQFKSISKSDTVGKGDKQTVMEIVSEEKLSELLQAQITKEIMKVWFPFENNKYSERVLNERGIYSGTQSDIEAVSLKTAYDGVKAGLADLGDSLINRSYIIVYDILKVETTRKESETAAAKKALLEKAEKTGGKMGEKFAEMAREIKVNKDSLSGFNVDFNIYLYQVEVNLAQIRPLLSEGPESSDPNAINQLNILAKPVANVGKGIAQLPAKGKMMLLLRDLGFLESEFDNWDDAQLLSHFAQNIVDKSLMAISMVNKDFQVQSPVVSTSPIGARVGTKEGLIKDQRFFVMQLTQNADGKQFQKRKGAVRVKKVAENIDDKVVAQRIEAYKKENNVEEVNPSEIEKIKESVFRESRQITSSFYQICGGGLTEGMNLVQATDLGLGVLLYGGTLGNLSALLEVSLPTWAGFFGLSAINNIIPSGTKLYVKYSIGLSELETEPVIRTIIGGHYTDVKGELGASGFGFGFSKDFCFARRFAVTPYLGVSFLGGETNKFYDPASTTGLELGGNFTFSIVPSIQIMLNANFNTVMSAWFSKPISVNGGLRYSF